MGETLTFKDGTVLNNSHAFAVNGTLFVYIQDPEATFESVFNLLNDPENTEQITENKYGIETVFEGYTGFYTLTKDEIQITAGLKREP